MNLFYISNNKFFYVKKPSLVFKLKIVLIHIVLVILHNVVWFLGRWRAFYVYKGVFSPFLTVSSSILLGTAKSLLRVLYRTLMRKLIVLEIGCGSGYITLGLVRHREVGYIIAIDIDINALYNTRKNLMRYMDRVDVVNCTEASCIRSKCIDMAISNPPYLPCPYKISRLWCADIDENILIKIVIDSIRCSSTALMAFSSLSRTLHILRKYNQIRTQVLMEKQTLFDIVEAVVLLNN